MKRYLVFAGQDHYPGGGWEDIRWQTNDLDDARSALDILWACRRHSWWQLVDTADGGQVEHGRFGVDGPISLAALPAHEEAPAAREG